MPAAAEASQSGAGADASSSSSKGGWGVGGWGLGGLSSRLQQVALGAAKDLQELTASVQQVGKVCVVSCGPAGGVFTVFAVLSQCAAGAPSCGMQGRVTTSTP
jgi:hypothetical protein